MKNRERTIIFGSVKVARSLRKRGGTAGQDGFTLVGPRVLNYLSESREKAAKIQIQNLSNALDLFYLDAGRFPSSSEGLIALARPVSAVTAWNGPYVKGGAVPNDPWGNAYVYKQPAEQAPYEIRSLGSDGQEGGTGTAADLTSVQN